MYSVVFIGAQPLPPPHFWCLLPGGVALPLLVPGSQLTTSCFCVPPCLAPHQAVSLLLTLPLGACLDGLAVEQINWFVCALHRQAVESWYLRLTQVEGMV